MKGRRRAAGKGQGGEASAKPYDAEQLRTIALGAMGAGWYVLTNPENAREVIRRLLATLYERSVTIDQLDTEVVRLLTLVHPAGGAAKCGRCSLLLALHDHDGGKYLPEIDGRSCDGL